MCAFPVRMHRKVPEMTIRLAEAAAGGCSIETVDIGSNKTWGKEQ